MKSAAAIPDDGQQHQVHCADPERRLVARRGQHQQRDQLDHRHPKVADAGVDRQRRALQSLGVERVDVGQRGRVVAAAQSGQRRTHDVRPQRQPGIGQQHDGGEGRDQQHERRERRPVAPAVGGDAQRVGNPRTATDQGGDGAEQELVAGGKTVDGHRHEERHDRPQRPDREGDVVGRHRAEQVAPGDLLVARLPGRGVVRIPVGAAQAGVHTDPPRQPVPLNGAFGPSPRISAEFNPCTGKPVPGSRRPCRVMRAPNEQACPAAGFDAHTSGMDVRQLKPADIACSLNPSFLVASCRVARPMWFRYQRKFPCELEYIPSRPDCRPPNWLVSQMIWKPACRRAR